MTKKFITKFVSILSTFCLAFGVASCDLLTAIDSPVKKSESFGEGIFAGNYKKAEIEDVLAVFAKENVAPEALELETNSKTAFARILWENKRIVGEHSQRIERTDGSKKSYDEMKVKIVREGAEISSPYVFDYVEHEEGDEDTYFYDDGQYGYYKRIEETGEIVKEKRASRGLMEAWGDYAYVIMIDPIEWFVESLKRINNVELSSTVSFACWIAEENGFTKIRVYMDRMDSAAEWARSETFFVYDSQNKLVAIQTEEEEIVGRIAEEREYVKNRSAAYVFDGEIVPPKDLESYQEER